MIVREIVKYPKLLETFDWFNDYKDTRSFLVVNYPDKLPEFDAAYEAAGSIWGKRERPLAERITQGPITATKYTGPDDSWRVGGEFPHRVCGGSNKVSGADAELIAEAFNVTHETGRTPRQLADERAELIEALEGVITHVNQSFPRAKQAGVSAQTLLARIK